MTTTDTTIRPHDGTINDMQREIDELRALVARGAHLLHPQVTALDPNKAYVIAIHSSEPVSERSRRGMRIALKRRGIEALVLSSDGKVDVLEVANDKRVEELQKELAKARKKIVEIQDGHAVVLRQLVTLREALETYATGDAGHAARQALHDVFGPSRYDPLAEGHYARTAPLHHIMAASRAVGRCGVFDKSGTQACMLPAGHGGAHGGWAVHTEP